MLPEREWQPKGTYGLLAAMAATFIAQLIVVRFDVGLHDRLFVIDTGWYLRPWSVVTSTFAHGGVYHILLNGMVLYFFGPHLERIWGLKRYLALFFIAGAIAGVLQVHLAEIVTGATNGALGASGAIMMLLGALTILAPKMQILLFLIVPVPLWAATIGFAVLDILGAFNPGDGIGNFAHLSGLALGLYFGYRTKQDLAERGLVLQY